MSSNRNFESRLDQAFREMEVSVEGDTSDEIWQEWKELDDKYRAICKKRYELPEGAELPYDLYKELEGLGQSLLYLCTGWIEYNGGEIRLQEEKSEIID